MLGLIGLIALWIVLIPILFVVFMLLLVMEFASVRNWLHLRRKIRIGYRNPIGLGKQFGDAVIPTIAGVLGFMALVNITGGWGYQTLFMILATAAIALLVSSRILHKWVWA